MAVNRLQRLQLNNQQSWIFVCFNEIVRLCQRNRGKCSIYFYEKMWNIKEGLIISWWSRVESGRFALFKNKADTSQSQKKLANGSLFVASYLLLLIKGKWEKKVPQSVTFAATMQIFLRIFAIILLINQCLTDPRENSKTFVSILHYYMFKSSTWKKSINFAKNSEFKKISRVVP